MSALSRTCLRLAACVALRGATLAGDQIFDSRIGELPSSDPEEFRPIVTVFTEEQDGPALSGPNGGPPFRTTVELIFEIGMALAQRSNDDAQYQVGYPSTSADLEATLDVLEAQVRLALFESMATASLAFRKALIRAQSVNSVRFVQADAQDRIALRYVTLKCEVVDGDLLSFDSTKTGLAMLPKPFDEVAAMWPADAPERDVATKIAAALAQPTVPLLKTLRINPADDPPAASAPEQWTPAVPETPPAIEGPTISADWDL